MRYGREQSSPIDDGNYPVSPVQQEQSPVSTSRDPLNPLAPPRRGVEGIREILRLVHDLAVAELHNAHRVCGSPLVGDGVFRDPEITLSENSLDVET
jgi:hypothetical protein